MIKTCRKCGVELIPGINLTKSLVKHHGRICKDCYNKEQKGRYIEQTKDVQPKITNKKLLKNRVEEFLQTGSLDGAELYKKVIKEFGGKFSPNKQSFIQLCMADRQRRFVYKNKVMRLRTALEIQEYLVEHEIVGCAK